MAVQLTISYETLLELVNQLSAQQKDELLTYLQGKAQHQALSADEKLALLRSSTFDVAPGPAYSDRRQDWYGDDGR